MKLLLVFVAVLSLSQGEECMDFLGSLHLKVIAIEQEISSMVSRNSGKYEYMGCYKDDADRMIKDKQYTITYGMTLDWCFSYCREGNYKYATAQNGYACFCGNTIDTIKYPKMPENDCVKECTGNASQVCGGGWRNNLYRLV